MSSAVRGAAALDNLNLDFSSTERRNVNMKTDHNNDDDDDDNNSVINYNNDNERA